MTDSQSPSPPPIMPVAPAPGATPSGPAGGSAGGAPVTVHPSVTSATPGRLEPPLIDYSLPITTTYLKHMRSLGLTDDEALNLEKESSMSHSAAKRRAKVNTPIFFKVSNSPFRSPHLSPVHLRVVSRVLCVCVSCIYTQTRSKAHLLSLLAFRARLN
ncbi:Hypothetical predicted protein [Cloeon dipterum]|nr:Hypothetical predicted protein [Cloeon dipterum]